MGKESYGEFHIHVHADPSLEHRSEFMCLTNTPGDSETSGL